jgi:uncharacterized membrane protein
MSDAHPHHLATFEVLMFGFDGMETARDTVTDLKAEHKLADTHILADAIISHAPTGKIHMHETGGALVGGGIGVVGGGMVAMFAGPVALPFLMAAGALLGGVAGHMAGRLLPAADLREVAHTLPLNSSAYLVLVEHDDARRLEELFREREARIVSTRVDSEMAGVLGHALAEKLAARAADAVPAGSGAAAPM